MYQEIIFYLKQNKQLTKEENTLIDRINETLANISNAEYDKVINSEKQNSLAAICLGSYFPQNLYEISYRVKQIKILQCQEKIPKTQFNNSVKLYSRNVVINTLLHSETKHLDNEQNIPISEFERFVNEQKIPFIFVTNFYMALDKGNEILNFDINEFYQNLLIVPDAIEIINDIVLQDINTFNKIIQKIETSTITESKYSCFYQGITISATEKHSENIDKDLILKLLLLINLNQLAIAFEEKKEKYVAEYEHRKTNKLIAIEKKIRSDNNFMKCSSKVMRLNYLKDLLKNENDEVIEYFNMRRRSDTIVANGNDAQFWIDKIWTEINNK